MKLQEIMSGKVNAWRVLAPGIQNDGVAPQRGRSIHPHVMGAGVMPAQQPLNIQEED